MWFDRLAGLSTRRPTAFYHYSRDLSRRQGIVLVNLQERNRAIRFK